MLTTFLIKYIFRKESEFSIMLGEVIQEGSTFAAFSSTQIWQRETTIKKIKSILSLKWRPSENLLQSAARETLMNSIFGFESDYGSGLLKINAWHNSRQWNLDKLIESDLIKHKALDALTILVRTKHREVTFDYLHLNIAEHATQMCILLHPMVVKIPVTSIQHYIDIHSAFAFNEIRKAAFPNTDDVISYIYEIQYIQQKIALSLHELVYLIDYNEKQKGDAMLIKAELSAISEIEIIFSYLKASIEKTVILLGLIYGIKNLETKKTHKLKIDALDKVIPSKAKQVFYYDFIFEFIKSESLETLNNYRTGILHKKGIADLQPHMYVGQSAKDVPLKKIFEVLIEQHSKNTAVLIGTYALLTDELVNIDPPTVKFEELPF